MDGFHRVSDDPVLDRYFKPSRLYAFYTLLSSTTLIWIKEIVCSTAAPQENSLCLRYLLHPNSPARSGQTETAPWLSGDGRFPPGYPLLDAPDSGFVSDPAGQLARGRLTEAGIDPQVAFQPQAVLPAVLVQPGK